jgi:hypothetical protein
MLIELVYSELQSKRYFYFEPVSQKPKLKWSMQLAQHNLHTKILILLILDFSYYFSDFWKMT